MPTPVEPGIWGVSVPFPDKTNPLKSGTRSVRHKVEVRVKTDGRTRDGDEVKGNDTPNLWTMYCV